MQHNNTSLSSLFHDSKPQTHSIYNTPSSLSSNIHSLTVINTHTILWIHLKNQHNPHFLTVTFRKHPSPFQSSHTSKTTTSIVVTYFKLSLTTTCMSHTKKEKKIQVIIETTVSLKPMLTADPYITPTTTLKLKRITFHTPPPCPV